jgi:hypothetical protein
MKQRIVGLAALLAACSGAPEPPPEPTPDPLAFVCARPFAEPPACGSGPMARDAVLPGTADAGFDAALAAKAERHDRVFHAFIAEPFGVNLEAVLPEDPTAERALLEQFVAGDGWDFEAATGRTPDSLVERWNKVAGAYAGVGVAADAYRYGVLRDEGAACADVDRARTLLERSVRGMLDAVVLPDTVGVIARGYSSSDPQHLGSLMEIVPLFDGDGDPLPEEKDNGTWRDDVSGQRPGYVWEDSCSRDMLVGWAAGFGAVWEVLEGDPTFDAALREQVADAAASVGATLRTVQDSGYDLEIRDADGRMTYHGILHHESVDRFYVEGAGNAVNAVMSLGIGAALAGAGRDEAAVDWLRDDLLATRGLAPLVAERLTQADFGLVTNYSGTNMAMLGAVLVDRHLCDAEARADVAAGVAALYGRPDEPWQPIEQGQALYDLTQALLSRHGPGLDEAALDRAAATLVAFPDAPYINDPTFACTEDDIDAGSCTSLDGTVTLPLNANPGRGDVLVSTQPVPWSVRPPSNYHWRSNAYRVDRGGDGRHVFPAVDFRYVYWLGRWARR